jgi:cell division protein FtsI (penicillin-binding protein 3)
MAALFLLLAGRLVQLQGFQSQTYAKMAEQQRTRTVAQEATRGEIVDRSGQVLAADVAADDIYVQPPKVTDAIAEATKLAPVLKMSVPDVLAKLITSGTPFAYVTYDVDTAVGQAVTKLNLPGIGVEATSKRLYPTASLAANVLGTVGRDGTGLAGLEYAYNQSLAGQKGTLVVEEDPQGRTIPSGVHRGKDPVAGEGLKLTLDRDIQYYAEKVLADSVRSTGAIKGAAIVLDPKTGDIYAMAQAPGFDPNKPDAVTSGDLINQDVAWTFEPGSVNKLITVSAAVNQGLVNPLSEVDIPATNGVNTGIQVDDKVIHDAEAHAAERSTVAGVIATSSNMGSLLISRRLPARQTLEDALRAFGLGSLTGVGLPGESAGLLAKASDWSNTMAATIPYGQSMSVTPLQVAMAYATIANGGVRVTPRIVDGMINSKGKVEKAAPRPTERVVSTQTAKTMTEMLEQVTTGIGTAPLAAIPGYRIAGKTGTASRIDPKTGKYNGYVSSFVGFAPADKASLVVLVSLDNPQGDIFGGTTAAPAFQKIMSFALTSLRIPPSGTQPTKLALSVP